MICENLPYIKDSNPVVNFIFQYNYWVQEDITTNIIGAYITLINEAIKVCDSCVFNKVKTLTDNLLNLQRIKFIVVSQ